MSLRLCPRGKQGALTVAAVVAEFAGVANLAVAMSPLPNPLRGVNAAMGLALCGVGVGLGVAAMQRPVIRTHTLRPQKSLPSNYEVEGSTPCP